jgi:hypothetical protein
MKIEFEEVVHINESDKLIFVSINALIDGIIVTSKPIDWFVAKKEGDLVLLTKQSYNYSDDYVTIDEFANYIEQLTDMVFMIISSRSSQNLSSLYTGFLNGNKYVVADCTTGIIDDLILTKVSKLSDGTIIEDAKQYIYDRFDSDTWVITDSMYGTKFNDTNWSLEFKYNLIGDTIATFRDYLIYPRSILVEKMLIDDTDFLRCYKEINSINFKP